MINYINNILYEFFESSRFNERFNFLYNGTVIKINQILNKSRFIIPE